MISQDLNPQTIRIQRILSILQEQNGSSIRALAEELNVSEMTIRRDIDELDSAGVIRRVHGAVIFNPDYSGALSSHDSSIDLDIARHVSLQRQLSQTATSLINNGDSVLIDCGELAPFMAQCLPSGLHLSVSTYSSTVFKELHDSPDVDSFFFFGGEYHTESSMCCSDDSANSIRRFRFTKAFIFPDGIHSEFGITCKNIYEVQCKRAAIESSVHTVLVAESSIFDCVSRNFISGLNKVHTVVTDSDLSDIWRTSLDSLGIQTIFAC